MEAKNFSTTPVTEDAQMSPSALPDPRPILILILSPLFPISSPFLWPPHGCASTPSPISLPGVSNKSLELRASASHPIAPMPSCTIPVPLFHIVSHLITYLNLHT